MIANRNNERVDFKIDRRQEELTCYVTKGVEYGKKANICDSHYDDTARIVKKIIKMAWRQVNNGHVLSDIIPIDCCRLIHEQQRRYRHITHRRC